MVQNGTLALLVVKDDALICERYYNGHDRQALSMAFSMSKSFASLLIPCAMEDGLIRSVDQPVTDFIPELAGKGFEKVTLRHLLQMTSGIRFQESDNPFGRSVRLYYGDSMEAEILRYRLKEAPGTRFEYKSADTMMLTMILSRVLAPKTVTAYMQEKFWEPMGMEHDGLWATDWANPPLEKAYCCISARARDFAKFGLLYLHQGNWQGKQLVPKSWVEMSTCVDQTEGSSWEYQYHWWILSKERGDFRASGHLGQYLYVYPAKNLVIVRLGENKGLITTEEWKEFLWALADAIG